MKRSLEAKEICRLRRELQKLSCSVINQLARLDSEMKKPSSFEHGKIVAGIANDLDMANDFAMHFGLGLGFRKISKMKGK